MVKVDLKRIAKATAKGRTYYYAWRGGPRLRGDPGSREFMASYHEAHENQRAPNNSRFRSIRHALQEQRTTQSSRTLNEAGFGAGWLDRISDHFGDLRIAQFDRPKR